MYAMFMGKNFIGPKELIQNFFWNKQMQAYKNLPEWTTIQNFSSNIW